MPNLIANPHQAFQVRNGTKYKADVNGIVSNVSPGDVSSLLNMGCLPQPVTSGTGTQGVHNLTATSDPVASSDSKLGYSAGSWWMNTTTGILFSCYSASVGAAVWRPLKTNFIGRLIGANFNSTADQAITMLVPANMKYRVTKITALNTSVAGMSTAAGGVYPATSKGGSAVVAAAQAYTGLTNASTALDLTLATPNAVQAANTKLYLSLTTAQGAAATADLFVFGDVYA